MKTAVDLVLIVAWVAATLAVVHGVGHYRRVRVIRLGLVGPNEYRGEKDAALWLVVFLAGTLLGAIACLAAIAVR
jgi:hypothetical protein